MGFAEGGGILPWHVAIRVHTIIVYGCVILYEKCWNTDTRHICMEGELPIHILVTLRFMYVFGATVSKTKYYC